MTTWSDDFNRADGALGPDWSTNWGTPTINSGRLWCPPGFTVLPTRTAPVGNQRVEAIIQLQSMATGTIGVGMRCDVTVTNYFNYTLENNFGSYRVYIGKHSGGGASEIGSAPITAPANGDHTMICEIIDNHHRLTWDGTLLINVLDIALSTNDRHFLSTNTGSCGFNAFAMDVHVARSMVATPDPLWVGGGQQTVTLTGSGTAWTAGEPGSSTVTVDHGTVEFQRVDSATQITLVYTPADYIGTVTFTESEYGLTASVEAVAVMPEGYGEGECRLTDSGAALINDTAAETPLTKRFYTRNTMLGMPVIDYTYEEMTQALAKFLTDNGWLGNENDQLDLWSVLAYLWGGEELLQASFPTPGTNSLAEKINALQAAYNALTNNGAQTLSSVITSLEGVNLIDNTQLSNDLGITGQGTYASVLDAIVQSILANATGFLAIDAAFTALRGGDADTLYTLKAALRGNGVGLPEGASADLTETVKRLGTLQASVANVAADVVSIAVDVGSILLDVLDVVSDIAAIIDLLNEIKGLIVPTPPTVTVVTAPVWPGESLVTIGDAYPLVDGITITGPLHGLLLTIDSYPVRYQHYMFGSVSSFGRVGMVIFATDRGDYERSQTFALDRQVLCPQQMAIADHAIVKVNSGWGGTVRAFTINTTEPE